MSTPYISKSTMATPPPDPMRPGASYLGDAVPGRPAGVSAPSGESLPPPTWFDAKDPRCGHSGGGVLANPNLLQEYWLTVSDDNDPFIVQLASEDHINGRRVSRATYVTVNVHRNFDQAGLRRLAAAATTAANLLGSE
jgi:hypothetical protein